MSFSGEQRRAGEQSGPAAERDERSTSAGPTIAAEDVDLVIRRAAELDRARGTPEPTLSPAELLRIGVEAGLSPEAIQRAIAELRTRQLSRPVKAPLLDRLVPVRVSSERLLDSPASLVQSRLRAALKDELLEIEERHGDRILWHNQPGLRATVQRALDWGGQRVWRDADVTSEVTDLTGPGGSQARVVLSASIPGSRTGGLIGAAVGCASPLVVAAAAWAAGLDPHATHVAALGAAAASASLAAATPALLRAALKPRLRKLRAAIERVLEKVS